LGDNLIKGASYRRWERAGRLLLLLYFIPFFTALLLPLPQPALVGAAGGLLSKAEAAVPGTTGGVAITAPVTMAPGAGLFPDAAGHWAAEPINFLGALDIVGGYPDGSCRPDQPLTVTEAVVLLLRSTEYSSAGGRGSAPRTPSAGRTPLTDRTPSTGRTPVSGRAPLNQPGRQSPLAIPPEAAWAAGDLALKTGQWVRVALRDDTIWQLEPLEVIKVSGKVESITDRRLYLDKFDKTLGNLFLDWERARLSDKDGKPYSGSGLKPGASVEIACLDWDLVLEIKFR